MRFDGLGRVGWDNGGGPSHETFSTDDIDDGLWHHVVFVRAGTGYQMYVDGQAAQSLPCVRNNPPVACGPGAWFWTCGESVCLSPQASFTILNWRTQWVKDARMLLGSILTEN